MVYCIKLNNDDTPQHDVQKNWAQVKNICAFYCDYLFIKCSSVHVSEKCMKCEQIGTNYCNHFSIHIWIQLCPCAQCKRKNYLFPWWFPAIDAAARINKETLIGVTSFPLFINFTVAHFSEAKSRTFIV